MMVQTRRGFLHGGVAARPATIRLSALISALTLLLTALLPAAAFARNDARLNADGVLVIDGKKVFPIGFTMPPPPDGKTPTGKNAIQELADAGATFLRNGAMNADWNEATIAEQRKWLDAAAQHGMYCLVNLRELGSIGPNDAKKEALLRRLILAYRNHPGMGVYKHVDEPEWGKHPIPPMLHATSILRELDPRHPIEITQAPRGTVETMRPYNAACDILATDIYPVGYPPGSHSLRPNREISMVGDYTRIMTELARPDKKAVWMTLQIAWSGVVKPGKTLRFPTAAEERFMTYQAIINGARGLLYFGGSLPQAMTPEDRALGWNWRFWERALRPVIEEIGSHSPLYPALVAPDSTLKVLPQRMDSKGLEAGVELCVREVGDDLFVLACKREGATVQVNFTGLPANVGEGEVLFESPRTVTAKKGAFTDWLGPFEVHVYRFHRGKTSAASCVITAPPVVSEIAADLQAEPIAMMLALALPQAGARLLELDSPGIGALTVPSGAYVPIYSPVVYDKISGGAAYTRELFDRARERLEEATPGSLDQRGGSHPLFYRLPGLYRGGEGQSAIERGLLDRQTAYDALKRLLAVPLRDMRMPIPADNATASRSARWSAPVFSAATCVLG